MPPINALTLRTLTTKSGGNAPRVATKDFEKLSRSIATRFKRPYCRHQAHAQGSSVAAPSRLW